MHDIPLFPVGLVALPHELIPLHIYGWIDLGAGALLSNGEWKLRGYDVLWDRRSGTIRIRRRRGARAPRSAPLPPRLAQSSTYCV